ncbi:FKBP12-associated protein [Coemansia sp. BCRC 34301]|nr:FKBP12-associated protein [Coemansia sp. BCRC 34301]
MTLEGTADNDGSGGQSVDDPAAAAAAATTAAESKRQARVRAGADKNQSGKNNGASVSGSNSRINGPGGKGKGKGKGSSAPKAGGTKSSSTPKAGETKSSTPRAGGTNGPRRAKGDRLARIDDAEVEQETTKGDRPQRQQHNRQRSRKSGKAGGVGGGRMFSGRLTLDDQGGDSDAPEGGDMGSNLSSELGRRLTYGDYECMICCDKVRARNAVWQCDTCWAIFHLGCVRRWAQACVADGASARWRCPGCQHARAAEPTHYMCFCGAQLNPEPARGTIPHACSRICGRRRGPHCPHACAQPCHPGPCAPCTALAPEQWCFCGRVAHQPRCGADFDPARAARSCGAECGEVLGCGRHTCTQPCHAGLCAPCPRSESQLCNCGRHSRDVRCGSREPFACGEPCGELLSCGAHRCERSCHAPDAHACPLDPACATTCHCGARSAASLGAPRVTCSDPVPSCGGPCGRALPGCAHACARPCHAGPCPPCAEPVDARCVCGATSAPTECHAARANPPRCERVCGRKRSCGRHKCSVRCCAGDSHTCPLACGRSLRCRQHQCTEPCHRGECPPCAHVGLDALVCGCGLTRLEPPVPCGAELPPCRHPCRRQRACGHVSAIAHECHAGPCPPCAVLVTAPCMCGAKEMRAVACHRRHAASCGMPCRRPLPCGGHVCQRTCHRADEPCTQQCRQPCGKPRRACGHPCPLPCHSPTRCDESQPCTAAVRAACACGRLAAQRPCDGTHAAPTLLCDDVCRIAERNRRLALAFNLPDRADAPLAGLVRATYPDDLLDFTRTNTSWVRGIENLVSAFIADPRRTTLRFVSMKSPLREFLHALAPFYGCASRSIDYEPNRSVCWDRGPTSTIPSIILSSAIRYTHAPQIVCSLRPSSESDCDNTNHSATHDSLPAIDYLAVSDLRHGLTADELAAEIRKLFPAAPFATRWKNEDLVEIYCTDPHNKYEHLPKWLPVLKKRLPHLGIAGLVTAQTAAATSSSPSPSPSPSSSKPPLAPLAKEPKTPDAWDDDNDDNDDDSVPDNWESLDIGSDN